MGNQTAVKKSAAKKPMAKGKSASSTALGLNKKTAASSAKSAAKKAPAKKPAGKKAGC